MKRKRGRKREEPGLIDRAMGWSFASALLAGWANSGAGALAVVGVAVVTGLGVFLAAAFLAGLLESALGGPRRAWPVGWALSQSGACALVAPLSSENSGWVAAAGTLVAVLGGLSGGCSRLVSACGQSHGTTRPQPAPAIQGPFSQHSQRRRSQSDRGRPFQRACVGQAPSRSSQARR